MESRRRFCASGRPLPVPGGPRGTFDRGWPASSTAAETPTTSRLLTSLRVGSRTWAGQPDLARGYRSPEGFRHQLVRCWTLARAAPSRERAEAE